MKKINHIKTAREARGLSIKEAAELCGVSYHCFRNWDQGKNYPEKNKVKIVKKIFKLSTEQVLGLK